QIVIAGRFESVSPFATRRGHPHLRARDQDQRCQGPGAEAGRRPEGEMMALHTLSSGGARLMLLARTTFRRIGPGGLQIAKNFSDFQFCLVRPRRNLGVAEASSGDQSVEGRGWKP